ncbi:MAG: hypothetical protein V7K15_29125 [Nostoc sp.]
MVYLTCIAPVRDPDNFGDAYGWLRLSICYFGDASGGLRLRICYFSDRSTNSFNLRGWLKSRIFAMLNALYSKLVA